MKVIQKEELQGKKTESQKEVPFIPEIKVVNLPSKFLPYPKNCSISYKTYTYGELETYNESKFSVPEEVNYLIQNITASFPKMDLAYFDYLAILLLRKISSFGSNQFNFPYHCKGCDKDGIYTATLMNVEFEDLNVPSLPVKVTIGGKELHFMPLTVGKYIELITRESDKPKGVQLLASQVVNVGYEEAEKVIYYASGQDKDLLDYLDELLYFGVKPIVFKCKNIVGKEREENKTCDFENSVKISPEVLTSPFRNDRESLRSRIRFGL